MIRTKQLLDKVGGVVALGRVFGISHSAVSQWGDKLPKLREYQIREKYPDWFDAQGKLTEDEIEVKVNSVGAVLIRAIASA